MGSWGPCGSQDGWGGGPGWCPSSSPYYYLWFESNRPRCSLMQLTSELDGALLRQRRAYRGFSSQCRTGTRPPFAISHLTPTSERLTTLRCLATSCSPSPLDPPGSA